MIRVCDIVDFRYLRSRITNLKKDPDLDLDVDVELVPKPRFSPRA